MGFAADIVIFDEKTIIDTATFEKPHEYPEGIGAVLGNGDLVLDGSSMTGNMPGQALYGPGKTGSEKPTLGDPNISNESETTKHSKFKLLSIIKSERLVQNESPTHDLKMFRLKHLVDFSIRSSECLGLAFLLNPTIKNGLMETACTAFRLNAKN
ncbi:MAG: hypothetical protein HKN33_17670 [Pyrinomonadaceae bacterium]|nr:hypothetical protein [Pyrinomonadaceae bacterium]